MSFPFFASAEVHADSDDDSSDRETGAGVDIALGVGALLLALALGSSFSHRPGETCTSFGRAGFHCVAAEKSEAAQAAHCDHLGRAAAFCRAALP